MSADGVADETIQGIKDGYRFIALNFANPDMVGHTGVLDAAIVAVEAVDTAIGRISEAARAAGKAGGSRMPATHHTIDSRQHYVYQEGSAVFKFAVTNMAEVSAQLAERNHLTHETIAWLVPHQANKRIIDATANRIGITEDKVMMNIERYGNTTAGTIPLLLWDYEKDLKKGDNLLMAAFGGGFTWGAVYVKWAYDSK
jgi:3-oxoacyl-[acyl-carrier-protein] synthase III